MTQEQETSAAGKEMIIECNEGLDVSMVTDFKVLLKQAAGQDLPIVLDATSMERIDGAGLQLFAAFFMEAQESGLSISWRSPPEALLHAAEITGLKGVLNL